MGRPRERSGERWRSGEAVSSVVGTVLMLGITLAVFTAFSLVALDSFGQDEEEALHAELGAVEADGRYLLQHRGGEPLTLSLGRLLFVLDGTETELALADLGGQTTDGVTWRIGETICLSGPQPPCQYGRADVARLQLVYGNSIVLTDPGLGSGGGGGGGGGGGAATTHFAVANVTRGTVTDLARAQSGDDAGAEATLLEGAGTGSPGAATATRSGASTTSNSATTPNNVLAGALSGDATDQRALMNANGDWVQVSGFTVPAGATGISSVTIGFEGRVESNGGTPPQVRLSYSVSGVQGATLRTVPLSATTNPPTDAQFTQVIPNSERPGGAWTLANLPNLAVRVEVANAPNRVAGIDHVYVTLQYMTAASTAYALDVGLNFTDVPPGTSQVLELAYRATGDTFLVQVWDGSGFVTRGMPLDAPTLTAWSYTLTPVEYNGGAPRLRFVDATPAGTIQGSLGLGYARMVTT